MPRYIIERIVGHVAPDVMQATGRKSNAVIAEMTGVVWVRSYMSDAEGKMYCEYHAPSIEAVLEHARRAGLPVDKISEVSLEISPEMFV
jgi:predicted  nucleic acid-binding Zn ribbon protein